MAEIMLHSRELACLKAHLDDGQCCAVVGLSNTGKSTLLRYLCDLAPADDAGPLFIYVDCNRMLDLSEQGFYEAVLRTVRSGVGGLGSGGDLQALLEEAYRRVVEPPSPFAIPVGFVEGIERLCDQAGRPLVLVLDEFDEPFAALEGRIFLNLRALRDRYGPTLTYVLGITRPLDEVRGDEDTAEFRELFAGQVCILGMLPGPLVGEWVRAEAAGEGVVLGDEEVAFVIEQAGAHPGLLRAVTRLLLRARAVAPETYGRMGTALIVEALDGDQVARRECARIWGQLTPLERRGLQALVAGAGVDEAMAERLAHLGLVDEEGRLFGRAFASFVRLHGGRRADLPPGVWLDDDAGEVYVDGRKVPTLTDLEYRLLRALYERKGKLCDKYRLVEQVWGEAYIDEVDDARIEKLVSRLRAKIEEDPAAPRYLVTVRGRGYRLLGEH